MQVARFDAANLTRLVALLVALLSIAAPSTRLGATHQPSAKLDSVLQERANLTSGHTPVIVRLAEGASFATIQPVIRGIGGDVRRTLPGLSSQVALLPNAALAGLANHPFVESIAFDRMVVCTMERTGATIGSTAIRQAFGYDGSGVGVAIIDSGVTGSHDDLLDPSGAPRVERFIDVLAGQQQPYDQYGHGSHVAGIIAGNGSASGGARAGIAPGVGLTVVKALDGSGRGRISDVIAGIEQVVALRNTLNIRVLNLSLAAGVYQSYTTDPLALATERAVKAGIVVVTSSGNTGVSPEGRARYRGITAPGNAPWVLTVGASSHMGTIARSDDTIAPFASRGPTAVDYDAKPDVVAPGVGIESLAAPGSALYSSMSAFLLNGTTATSYMPYLSMSGTSMSAPVVAGTVALMLQANPSLTPNGVKAILHYTAQIYANYDPLTQGAGFLNAKGAVELARHFAAPATVAYPDSAGWSRRILWGNYSIKNGRMTAHANAWRQDVTWGATSTPLGEDIEWGVVCATPSCDTLSGSWAWSLTKPRNVVWGTICGGADCASEWTVAAVSEGDTVVWGTNEQGETVVWGTNEGDTVVWGTTGDAETVVWGTNETDTVVWGTSCSSASCMPTIWRQ